MRTHLAQIACALRPCGSAAFRAQTMVRCTLTATGHTSTVGNGSVLSCGLIDQSCPHNRVGSDPAGTREGMQVARANGRLRGRQPKLRPNQARHLLELYDLGTYSVTELAELFGVGRQRSIGRSGGCDRFGPIPCVRSHIWQISSRHLDLDLVSPASDVRAR